MKTGWTLALTITLYLLQAPVTWSQESTPKEEFNNGVRLAKQKDYQGAIDAWLGALDGLDGEYRPKAHKALGLAYKKLDKLPEAWHHFTLYLKAAIKQDTKAGAWLEQVEKKLAKKQRRVVISCEQEGTKLYLGKSATGPAYSCPLTWWFLPGKRHIHAVREGFVSGGAEVDVRERGEQGSHTIALVAIAKEPDSIVKPPPDQVEPAGTPNTITKPAAPRGGSKILEWTLIGSGTAAVITGGILHGMASSANEELHDKYKDSTADDAGKQYDDEYGEQVLPKEVSAYLLYGIGGAALATGAVMMFLKPGQSDGDKGSSMTVAPMFIPRGTGAAMTLVF
jgi:hypothetical protein